MYAINQGRNLILILLAPCYTERRSARLHSQPGSVAGRRKHHITRVCCLPTRLSSQLGM